MFLKLDSRTTLLVWRIKTREIITFCHAWESFRKELEQEGARVPRGWALTGEGNKCCDSRIFDSLRLLYFFPENFSRTIPSLAGTSALVELLSQEARRLDSGVAGFQQLCACKRGDNARHATGDT